MGELYAIRKRRSRCSTTCSSTRRRGSAEELGMAFAEAERIAFINGTGTGSNQPLGIPSGPASGRNDGRNAARSACCSTSRPPTRPALRQRRPPLRRSTSCSRRFSRCAQAIGADAIFGRCTRRHLSLLAQTKDTIGRPIMVPSRRSLGQPPTFFGYPAMEMEHMPLMGAGSLPDHVRATSRRGFLIVDRIGIRVLQDPFSNKPYHWVLHDQAARAAQVVNTRMRQAHEVLGFVARGG